MLKLRINPIVVRDLKNIRDYIAEDNEEYAHEDYKRAFMVNLRIFRCFRKWDRISPNESAFGQTINMRYGKNM